MKATTALTGLQTDAYRDAATAIVRVHLGYRQVRTLMASDAGLQIVSDDCILWLTQTGDE